MSIASEISRISQNVADSLDAVAAKGVTVPSGSTSDDLPDLIAQITGGGSGGVYQDQDGYIVLDPNGGGGGGGNPTAPEKQINFIDYDGMIRYSYTAAEFAELEALPANPNHTGRVAQGWNWTLAQINAQLAACPGAPVWVGQQYTTSDGKTHVHIQFPANTPASSKTFSIRFVQTASRGVEIDWGDGSDAVSRTETGYAIRFNHTYSDTDDLEYDIVLTVVSGTFSVDYALCVTDDVSKYRARITDISFGNNVTSLGQYGLYGISGHCNITAPSGTAFSGEEICANAYGLFVLTISDGTLLIGNDAFYGCYGLSNVSLPGGISSIGTSAFCECYGLRGITIPSGVISIGSNAFSNCKGLTSISIPASVTSIGDSAFSGCTSISAYHFYGTTPPTLGSSAFSSIPSDCVIYVPSASVNAYKSATNWSAYSSYIQGE